VGFVAAKKQVRCPRGRRALPIAIIAAVLELRTAVLDLPRSVVRIAESIVSRA
jgi:hypothetical protein